MNITFSKRMAAFRPSIFSELSEYKLNKQAEGANIIDLSLGSPDLPPPAIVREELAKQASYADQYGYPLTGTPSFYEAVANYYSRVYGVDLDPKKEIVQTMGSQEGLVHLPMVFADPGDTILVTDPGYTAYETGLALAGAVPYYMPLHRENHFLPDLNAIPEEVARQAKLMIINYPGNPVPGLADREFFSKVIAFAKKYKIAILHDAAYSEFYFDDHKPLSFLSIEGAKDVGMEINSLSKSFSLAGARIAYIAGNAAMIQMIARFKSNLDYGVFYPIQAAGVMALNNAETIGANIRKIYQARRDVLVEGLKEIGWSVDQPSGGMFVWAKIPEGWNSREFAFACIDQAGVVMIPGIAFGANGEGYVRIALVQEGHVLQKAVDALKQSGIFSIEKVQ
ncbi:MAG TPA: LL-diaminopimelate aminotransferase [Chondromyces sp.]|nr:LL-diaminopimelate aminotransferase [Chondromyces sp.]